MTNLDEIDHQILRLLQADGRRTNRSLASEVGLAPSTTLERVRQLETKGMIRGYHANAEAVALGRPLQAMVAVRIRPKTQRIVNDIVDSVWLLPETLSVSLMSGPDDILVHLGVRDTDSLRQIVLDEIASLPGVVDERTSLVFEHRRKMVIEPCP